jgi:FixJ family two-component response regulator
MKTSPGILFVVDDDRKSRQAVAALASSMKIKCETFVSAQAFLDRYDASLTGCALVDFRLGDMNGLEVQDRLRALGSLLAVVIVTAYAEASLAVRAMENGAVAFIEKPYTNDDLADAVRKALDQSARARQSAAAQAEQRRCADHEDRSGSSEAKTVNSSKGAEA